MGKYTAIARKVLEDIRANNNEMANHETNSPSTTNLRSKKDFKLYSKILEDIFWLVSDDEAVEKLRAQGIITPVYTKQDILELGKIPKENLAEVLKAIHMAKKEFTFIKIEEIKRYEINEFNEKRGTCNENH